MAGVGTLPVRLVRRGRRLAKRVLDPPTPIPPDVARRALAARLRTAAATVLDEPPRRREPPEVDAAAMLLALCERARADDGAAVTWLLLAALTARLPEAESVRETARRLALDEPADVATWLLDVAGPQANVGGDPTALLRVAADAVLVDVDFSARTDHNTGIQRVVRSTVPHWVAAHSPELVVWNSSDGYRGLSEGERRRVLAWSRPLGTGASDGAPTGTVVVPWRSTLVLPEVPTAEHARRLAALAELSGNRVTLLGYDTIPVASADLMPRLEPEKFAQYLTLLKHASHVSGISETAAREFAGFVSLLPTQGLTGPTVAACPLPTELPAADPGTATAADNDPAEPIVLCVGSHEPRKNHLAVLDAAEHLWRAGRRFRLCFVGGASWASAPFDEAVRLLVKAGRPIEVHRHMRDDELWRTYRAARFTVFASLHEGYGLPVAESLAVGTPVITTGYGSTAEIAALGGCLVVDPRDDEALRAAMERLLTDDDELARLRAAALRRPRRTWAQYADEAWGQLVGQPKAVA